MRAKRILLLLIPLLGLASCHTYEVMHYKSNELSGKIKDISKYHVYINYKNKTYKVTKPTFVKYEIKGNITPVTNQAKANEIRNPATKSQMRKHKHDLNLFVQTAIKDSAVNVSVQTRDVKEATVIVSHSVINWKDIGNGIATVLVIALCVVLIGALVYWFTLGM